MSQKKYRYIFLGEGEIILDWLKEIRSFGREIRVLFVKGNDLQTRFYRPRQVVIRKAIPRERA